MVSYEMVSYEMVSSEKDKINQPSHLKPL